MIWASRGFYVRPASYRRHFGTTYSRKPDPQSRGKHVTLRYFYIREVIKDGHVIIHHKATEKQFVDLVIEFLNQ